VIVTKEGVYRFVSSQKLAVISSIGPDGVPQSAVIGIAVTPEMDIVFDTLDQSRKARNLVARPNCSLVIGWDHEVTVQYEGLATQHQVHEEGAWKEIYFAAWPECREHMLWPGLTYFVVSPRWLRYSDYNQRPPEIVEFTF
jgi:pyridoxine/pyridoxamine 5'-phosphate oxidase